MSSSLAFYVGTITGLIIATFFFLAAVGIRSQLRGAEQSPATSPSTAATAATADCDMCDE
jgi:hypothetical protein